jgi:LPS sulfotransferase NodH
MRRVSPRTILRQIRHRLLIAARYRFKSHINPETLLFVLAEPRSGSNLLLDYMRSLSDVQVTEEILNPWSSIGVPRQFITRRGVLSHIKHSIHVNRKVSVCKLMLHHLKWHSMTAANLADRFDNSKFIIIYRDNLLDQYVSTKILHISGIDRLSLNKPATRYDGTIRIDTEALLKYCNNMRDSFAALASDAILRGRSVVVSYDELKLDPQRLFQETLCPFMGVEYDNVTTELIKQSNRELSDVVENWNEIKPLADNGHFSLNASSYGCINE